MAFLEYTPRQTLFQFCSVSAFRGIIDSKHLWFSDLRSSNDPRELLLGYDRFLSCLQSVRDTEFAGERGRRLFELEGGLVPYFQNVNIFCACFSLNRDELAMWNQYGDGYGGVAIGFRPTALNCIPARLQRVRYVDSSTDQEYRDLVLEIGVELDRAGSRLTLEQWMSALVNSFCTFTSLKHSTWSYEREIRMIHNQIKKQPEPGWDAIFHTTGFGPDGDPVRWTQPLSRKSGTRDVQYLTFPFGHFIDGKYDASGAISEVKLSPNCTISEQDARELLGTNGFRDFSVTRSDCAIR